MYTYISTSASNIKLASVAAVLVLVASADKPSSNAGGSDPSSITALLANRRRV